MKPTVAVIGSGMAGVEAASSLIRHAGDDVNIVMVSDTGILALRPFFIYPPYSKLFRNPARTHLDLRKAAGRRGIELQQWQANEIDPISRVIRGNGHSLPYDYAIVATGAGMRPAEVPGLAENAYTIWGFEDSLKLAHAVEQMIVRAKRGERQRIVFNIAKYNKCGGPMYEMVFMTETHLRKQHVRDLFDIAFTTAEPAYIAAFGAKLHEATEREFADRGITARHSVDLKEVQPNLAIFADGSEEPFDWMIGFPPYIASTTFAGLPVDDRGFIQADMSTWAVDGTERLFAIGDGANFPVKQAFLALGMAGTVARNIADDVAGKSPDDRFTPLSMCIMEQFDSGLYAQVPLVWDGDGSSPVAVDSVRASDYTVRDNRLWQVGKMGMYMTMVAQMGSFHTFHEGAIWSAMEKMIKGMEMVTPSPV
ncbi:MAG: FAD-dependent oxidoreductase [Thermomicrobiales bacterium]|nr:FAD-dependent oxidoreductase [Thermomicrobiales bacterium]